jgi:hypothetical protein
VISSLKVYGLLLEEETRTVGEEVNEIKNDNDNPIRTELEL